MILLSKFHKYFPAFQMMIILIIITSSSDQAKLSTNSISTHSRAVKKRGLIWESNCMGHQNCRAALPIQPGMGAAILYVQMYTYTYTHTHAIGEQLRRGDVPMIILEHTSLMNRRAWNPNLLRWRARPHWLALSPSLLLPLARYLRRHPAQLASPPWCRRPPSR